MLDEGVESRSDLESIRSIGDKQFPMDKLILLFVRVLKKVYLYIF